MLPFTQQQFLAVFSDYNEAIWPSQILAYLLGGAAVLLLFRQTARSSRAIAIATNPINKKPPAISGIHQLSFWTA